MIVNSNIIKNHSGSITYCDSVLNVVELDEYREFFITESPSLRYTSNPYFSIFLGYSCVIHDEYGRYKHVNIPLFSFYVPPKIESVYEDDDSVYVSADEIVVQMGADLTQYKSRIRFHTHQLRLMNKYIWGELWTDFLTSNNIKWYIE